MDRHPRILLFILGVAVHGGAALMVQMRGGGIDAHAFDSLDGREFFSLARNLASHGLFSTGDAPPFRPDTWRTPGYPLLLAGSVFLFGPCAKAMIIIQQVLCIINVLLFHHIVERWMSGRRALLAATLFLLEPYGLWYSFWLLSTTWFVTVLLLTWVLWVRATESGRLRWMIAVGASMGLLVLIRPVALLVPLIPMFWFVRLMIRHTRNEGQRAIIRPIQSALFFALACLLVIGSWMARNHAVGGHWALSDQGGVVLAYFKATEVVLWSEGRPEDRYLETTLDAAHADQPHPVWEEIDKRLRAGFADWRPAERETLHWRNLAQGNRAAGDSFAVSQALSDIGMALMKDRPWSTLGCCLVRGGSILTFPLNLAIRPPRGIVVDRFPALLKGLPYTLLAVWMLIRLLRGRFGAADYYFPLACVLALLIATTPQMDPRFRVPMVPLMLAVALFPLAGSAGTDEPETAA